MKEIIIEGEYSAIVDADDYEKLIKYEWYINNGYAYAKGKERLPMHHFVLKPTDGKEIDHINRNRLDNRKVNLRLATRSQNLCNKAKRNPDISHSTYKGVTLNKNRFQARVVYDNVKQFDGLFNNEIAAANAYNYYARLHHGEFAVLNNVPFMNKEEWEKYLVKTSSGYKGVHWHQREKKWRSSYKFVETNKTEVFGFFDSEIAAANMFNHKLKDRIDKKKLNKIKDEDYMSLEECEEVRSKFTKTSKYRGVFWHQNKWAVSLYYNGKRHYLGSFDNEEDAALVFNNKAIEWNIKRLDKRLNKIGGE